MKEVVFDKGLNEDKVREISKIKGEPKWMCDFRVKSYKEFENKELPSSERRKKINLSRRWRNLPIA